MTQKPTRDYYTLAKESILKSNGKRIESFVERVAANIQELTPLVREKFSVKEFLDNADVLYDIEKTTTLLNGYDNDLRLVVRVKENYVVYALEQVEDKCHTDQKLIFIDAMPNEDWPEGVIDLQWINESFMTYALGLSSFTSDALNQARAWGFGASEKDTQLFVDLFDKKNFE